MLASMACLLEDIRVTAAHDPPPGRESCVLRDDRDETPDMRPHHRTSPGRILALLAGVLILKVTASVISNYGNYLPPNFASDFLRGRERDFAGTYRWAFYTHILSGPVSLILGLILIGERSRSRFPRWHRHL